MEKNKVFGIGAVVLMMLVAIVPTASSISLKKNSLIEKEISNQDVKNIITMKNPSADLKIRQKGGEWMDQHLTCKVGTEIEFKINAESNKDYFGVVVKIDLPNQDNDPEETMFRYIRGSVSPVPDSREGIVFGTDHIVIWAYDISKEKSWSKEMSFRAKLIGPGSGQINLEVHWATEDREIDSVEDSVEITGKKVKYKNTCFDNKKTKYNRAMTFQIARSFIDYLKSEDSTKTFLLNSNIVNNNGGVNKWGGPYSYSYLWPPSFGIYIKVWIDDEVTRNLVYGHLLNMLVGALGPIGFIVAIYMEANLITICKTKNEGNGVTFRLHFPYFPAPAPWVGYVKPQ